MRGMWRGMGRRERGRKGGQRYSVRGGDGSNLEEGNYQWRMSVKE